MGGLLFVFVVINALIWPTQQTAPAGCSILRDPHSRVKCGGADIDEATCNSQGCCFDSSTANAVSCFLPANCAVGNRKTCELGFKGINQAQCECRGCCFDATATAGIPCFQTGPTVVPPQPTPGPTGPPGPTPVTKPPEPECVGKKMDLMFALDESSSINSQGFQDIKDFAKGIVEKLPIGANQMQVGLMTFSSSSRTRFTLRNHHTQARILNAIDKIKPRGGNTYTHTALPSLVDLMLPINGGRHDAMKVAIIETDGASKNKTATRAAAAAARAAGITLIAVGVGDYDKQEIHDIASDPVSEHVFTVKEFNQLSTIIAKITKAACSGTPPVPVTTFATTINPAKVPKFCKDIPKSERNGINYMIDPDGPFHGADPFIVECDFKGIGGVPVTMLHNKQEKKTCVSNCEERDYGCFVQTIQYRASGYQARTMVDLATKCFQFVNYDCYKSAIDYRIHDVDGPMTWWTDRHGKKMNYWPGGPKSGGCSCGKHKSCARIYREHERCNCDVRDRSWRNDHGTITDKKALPVSEVAVGDVFKPDSKACFTMGPLKCL